MQLGFEQEVRGFGDRKLNSKNVELTNRDLEIIEFIVEMKFAATEDVFEKFFKVTQSHTQAKSDLWARKRLLQLEQAKFLKAHKLHEERTTFYTPTYKAYYALTNIYPEKLFCKPALSIDTRTYGHDKTVLKCRLALESRFKITSWLSDRKLRSFPELTGGLSGVYVPDGIYTLPDGKSIAFELEIARKAKTRYAEKIDKYLSLLRSMDATKKKFECVVFVCAKESVRDQLVMETKIYGNIFRVLTMQEFINELNEGKK